MARPLFRRQYIINSQFQLRWAAMLALVAGFGSIVFAVPLYGSLNEQNQLLQEAINDEAKLFSASEDITILLMNLPETRLETAAVAGSHFDRAYASFEASKRIKDEIIVRNETQKTLVIASVPIIALLLFGMGILITHSVAGPLYVIKQQLETYGVTHTIDERALRRGDEFLDVYATMYRVLSKDQDQQAAAAATAAAKA